MEQAEVKKKWCEFRENEIMNLQDPIKLPDGRVHYLTVEAAYQINMIKELAKEKRFEVYGRWYDYFIAEAQRRLAANCDDLYKEACEAIKTHEYPDYELKLLSRIKSVMDTTPELIKNCPFAEYLKKLDADRFEVLYLIFHQRDTETHQRDMYINNEKQAQNA